MVRIFLLSINGSQVCGVGRFEVALGTQDQFTEFTGRAFAARLPGEIVGRFYATAGLPLNGAWSG